jgi:hypothetical protein
MGIFSGIQNTFKKSEAAVVVQNLFEIQKKVGIFPYNSAQIANQLVGDVWEKKPDIFSGKFGVRPHKLAAAAAALGQGVYLFQDDSSLRTACLVALAEILKTVDLNGRLYSFNNIDQILLGAATETFVEAAEAGDVERGNGEQKARIDLHYPACIREISSYIDAHPEPTGDDLIRIAVNAKVMYELFRHVAGAREFAAPLITNGMAVFSEIHGMELEASAARMKELVQDEVNRLARGEQLLTLPAIKAAYMMAQLVGFDETQPIR